MVQNCGPFIQNRGYFLVKYGFLSKIVDLFNKLMDLLFRKEHLENPLAMGLCLMHCIISIGSALASAYIFTALYISDYCLYRCTFSGNTLILSDSKVTVQIECIMNHDSGS